jgi:hypothetical protein
MRDLIGGGLAELRREVLPRRLRAQLGDRTVVDTTRGLLVW